MSVSAGGQVDEDQLSVPLHHVARMTVTMDKSCPVRNSRAHPFQSADLIRAAQMSREPVQIRFKHLFCILQPCGIDAFGMHDTHLPGKFTDVVLKMRLIADDQGKQIEGTKVFIYNAQAAVYTDHPVAGRT